MKNAPHGNHVGVPQPACNGCGNCIGGCNTGAKNSINMNYLADAKYHGAEIFTRVQIINFTIYNDSSFFHDFIILSYMGS